MALPRSNKQEHHDPAAKHRRLDPDEAYNMAKASEMGKLHGREEALQNSKLNQNLIRNLKQVAGDAGVLPAHVPLVLDAVCHTLIDGKAMQAVEVCMHTSRILSESYEWVKDEKGTRIKLMRFDPKVLDRADELLNTFTNELGYEPDPEQKICTRFLFCLLVKYNFAPFLETLMTHVAEVNRNTAKEECCQLILDHINDKPIDLYEKIKDTINHRIFDGAVGDIGDEDGDG